MFSTIRIQNTVGINKPLYLTLEKAMAPHSSTLAWKIPWMEEPGGPQSMGSLRVGQDSATSLSLFTFLYWRRQWQPTPVFLLENPRDGGAWWAAVSGVAQNQTQLTWLSSSSSSIILAHENQDCRLYYMLSAFKCGLAFCHLFWFLASSFDQVGDRRCVSDNAGL